MTTYAITLVDNVPAIITPQNQVLLIDTGSPSSFSETGGIEIGGQKHLVPTSLFGVVTANYLRQHMHHAEIAGIIGMNILSKAIYEFDYRNMILNVNSPHDEYLKDAIEVLDLSYAGGVPVLTIQVSGQRELSRFLLDTGAKLSYTIPQICAALQQVGTSTDFSPSFGPNLLATQYEDFSFTAGSTSFQHIIHENPQVTEGIRPYGVVGILGYHFMSERVMLFNPVTSQLIIK